MTYDIIVRLIADATIVPVVLIGAWALLFRVPKGRRFSAYSRVLMAGLTAYALAKFAAEIYQPSTLRPFEILGVTAGASYLNNPGFPSDHTLFVTAITCAVWFETRMKKTTLVLIALTVLIAIGRVVALVHTPLDVIAGALIALIGALWYSNVPRKQEEHGHGKADSERTRRRRGPVVGTGVNRL